MATFNRIIRSTSEQIDESQSWKYLHKASVRHRLIIDTKTSNLLREKLTGKTWSGHLWQISTWKLSILSSWRSNWIQLPTARLFIQGCWCWCCCCCAQMVLWWMIQTLFNSSRTLSLLANRIRSFSSSATKCFRNASQKPKISLIESNPIGFC